MQEKIECEVEILMDGLLDEIEVKDRQCPDDAWPDWANKESTRMWITGELEKLVKIVVDDYIELLKKNLIPPK